MTDMGNEFKAAAFDRFMEPGGGLEKIEKNVALEMCSKLRKAGFNDAAVFLMNQILKPGLKVNGNHYDNVDAKGPSSIPHPIDRGLR